MKVFKLKAIEKGRCTPNLQKKRFGKFLSKEECCFSVVGRDKSFDLETDTEKDREAWIGALTALMEFIRQQKQANKKFT